MDRQLEQTTESDQQLLVQILESVRDRRVCLGSPVPGLPEQRGPFDLRLGLEDLWRMPAHDLHELHELLPPRRRRIGVLQESNAHERPDKFERVANLVKDDDAVEGQAGYGQPR